MLECYTVQQMPRVAWFHQTGVPPHFGNIVSQILNECLLDKWSGTDGFLHITTLNTTELLPLRLCGVISGEITGLQIL
jgi:hypothetical protein